MPLPLYAGRYQLDELLGQGGMGMVYRATDLRTGGTVAVKVLSRALSEDGEYLERLKREARITASLTSPRVVRVIDLSEHEGTPFIVLEYVGGPTLDRMLAEHGPFSPQDAAAICLEVARALEAAHARGIVHRDLKPENIKVVDGQVKVLDFGIARMETDSRVTATGVYHGTPRYSAPERIGGPGDIRSDIYALGAMLFELLVGHPPYDGPTPVAVLIQHATAPLPDLPNEIPPPLRALVYRCLAKSPADRYQTPAEMVAALAKVMGRSPISERLHAGSSIPAPVPPVRPAPSLPNVHQGQHPNASLPQPGRTQGLDTATLATGPDSLAGALPRSTAENPDQPALSSTLYLAGSPSPANAVDASSARAVLPPEAGAPPPGPAARGRGHRWPAVAAAAVVLLAALGGLAIFLQGGRGGGAEAPAATPGTSQTIRPSSPSVKVTTLAGNGEIGITDGAGTAARLQLPAGVTVDSTGTIFFLDGNLIRRASANGQVTTLAGNNEAGFVNGVAISARFNSPRGIAVDRSGTLYIADQGNHAIRTLAPDGAVRTLAGGGSPGRADGQGEAARFNLPSGIAVGADGAVYVADTGNDRIRKITPAGVVTTLAGGGEGDELDGPAARARFSTPTGLAIGPDGTLYVADTYNARIRAVAPDGSVRTVAGSGEDGHSDGPAASASFSDPLAIAVNAQGAIAVLEKGNRIRGISEGNVVTLAGADAPGYADGSGPEARFAAPAGVAVAPDGSAIVIDTDNRRIRRITLTP